MRLLFLCSTCITVITVLAISSYGQPPCDVADIQTIAPSNSTVTIASAETLGSVTFCQVEATISTDQAKGDFITFEVSLPVTWNQRMLFIGNSVFGGQLPSTGDADYNGALGQDYAVVGTDMGHQSTTPVEAVWALKNPPAIKDFAYLAVHKSTQAAQALIDAYYSSTIQFSYFEGCSTGGREGIVEAEKFPKDFDGVIAGDPAIGDLFLGFNWNEAAILSPSGFLTTDALNIVDHAVTNQCGETDGIAAPSRLVLNPAVCNFQAATLPGLQCGSGQNPPGCLTAGEVATFNAIYNGPKDPTGDQIYPGYSVSDPNDINATDAGWSQMTGCSPFNLPCPTFNITEPEPWGETTDGTASGSLQWVVQDGYLRDIVFSDPTFAPLSLSFSTQRDLNQVNAKVARWGADGMEVKKLKKFVSDGHRLLIYHGWSDPVLSPFQSVNFFTSAQAEFGSTTSNNIRLFMVPGMHHCMGGPGPNFFDALTPLTQWVERAMPPDNMIATHFPNNDDTNPPDRTLPMCSYPELPTYSGTGDPSSANNWTCH